MRQELVDPARGLSRQTLEYVFEITIRVVSVELRGLDQTHDVGCAFASTQGAGKQPVRPSEGNRSDAVLHMIVIYG